MKEIVWKPSDEYVKKANITRFMKKHDIKSYDELIKRSTDDLEWFWDAVMKDLNVHWFEPYKKVLDTSKGIQWAKWFIGGKTNIVYNCVDRHAESERKENIAILWENESGNTRKITYETLHTEINKLANALKKIGVKKGDRVGIYMPMVPEIVVGFLAVIKIGAISVPIFSGFGAHAVASRLTIAGAKVLLTADGSMRRGKTVEIKKEIEKTVDQISHHLSMSLCINTLALIYLGIIAGIFGGRILFLLNQMNVNLSGWILKITQ